MKPYSWSSFTVKINIKASTDAIYNMWCTSAAIERWFLRTCNISTEPGLEKEKDALFTKGDLYHWRWHGWPDSVEQKGIILEANGMDMLAFTFGQETAEEMNCTIRIYTEQGENICEIRQDNIPETEKGKGYYHIGCLTGWTFYLTNLKSILEGGVDLRNKNMRLQHMLNS